LFVSDYSNHNIRKITRQGKCYFYFILYFLFIYFICYFVYFVNIFNKLGEVSTVAGTSKAGFADGPLKSALFKSPLGIYFDEIEQSLLVCDCENSRLRRISLLQGNLFSPLLSHFPRGEMTRGRDDEGER
jgi:hypothetical protein